jgi:SAM-dependent methyltransferase
MANAIASPHDQTSKTIESIGGIIATVNGSAWMQRRESIQKLLTPNVLRQCMCVASQESSTDLSGQGVYANAMEQKEGMYTNYDIVNAWQVNYVRGQCALDGRLLVQSIQCYNDDEMFGSFHASRPGSMVLDVGCNTGKNMNRACQHGGPGTEVFGIEFSSDSVAIAQQIHGQARAVQGDASANFVDEHGWRKKFSVVQCTAVLQHITPDQVRRALENMSLCLQPGGELLLTFKDAPTKDQMTNLGMGHWAEEVFTADIADKDSYLRDGFLRTIMWDDDYYPGVTSQEVPQDRDMMLPGIHRREFVFYSLEWMKSNAAKFGLIAEHVEVMPDSKIPFSALHWMVVFRRMDAA